MLLKRILAAFLSFVLLTAAIPCAFSALGLEEVDPMDNYVLHTIHQKKQFDVIPKSNSTTYGNAWLTGQNWSVTGVQPQNLALSLRFYFEDYEDTTNTSLVTKTGNSLYLSTEHAAGKKLSWANHTLKTVSGGALQPGVWNDILLPFSTGSGYSSFNFSADTFTFFWFEFSGISESTYTVRVKDVAIVDMSRREAGEETPDWDTTYSVATIPFSLQKTITGRGANTGSIAVARSFTAVDASSHDPEKLQLLMDITVNNVTTPGNADALAGISGQLELTSSGTCDQNERNYDVDNLALKHGKNEYAIPLAAFGATGGNIDLSAINYMRIYINSWPANLTDTIQLTVNNVRLVDVTDQVLMSTMFSDGMVFQQNKPMSIWGPGRQGDVATVKLYCGEELLETKTANTDAAGRWETAFSAREGGYTAYTIEVTVGNTLHKVIRDVLIGEVWIASGQSNMELTVSRDMDAEAIVAKATDPYIRLFLEPTNPYGTQALPIPGTDVPGAVWGYGNSAMHVARASSIGYTFALNLKRELDVPIGIIDASVGGSVIEAWLPREAVAADETLKTELLKRGLYYDEEFWPDTAGSMSTWYNQKIGPLAGLNIAGVIWYQGESNSNRSEIYDLEIDLLKKSWGAAFGFPNGDMPLIFTQVAPYRYDNGASNSQHLGYLAMYMERGWKRSADKNTAMLTIYDLPLEHMKDGVSSDPIHPRVKTPVAERFAQSALDMVYGGGKEYTAPVYKHMEIQDGAIYVTFDRVGEGLTTTDDTATLHGFTIAGADGVYVGAEAIIVDADTVKVWNNRVNDPKHVIYAFDNFNQAANLCNSEGIPASPLRTVQLNDTTLKKDASVIYFTAQDWMLADRDVWVYDSTNETEWNTGYRPSFAVTGGTYRYDDFLKAEGTASLRVTHNGTAAVSPILTYESMKQSWVRYKTISVKLLNPDRGDATVSMTVTCGSTTYQVPTVEGADTITLPDKGETYTQVTFDLTALKLNGAPVSNSASLLSSLKTATFHVNGGSTLFFDAFSFGLTEPQKTDDAINAAADEVTPDVQTVRNWLQQYAVNEADFTPSQLTKYYETKAALEAVLNEADATPLHRSDAMAAWLAAVNALNSKAPVDKTALQTAVDTAINDLSAYTDDSAAAYQAALQAARAVLEDDTATQEAVDKALADLTDARNALEEKAEELGLLGDVNKDGRITSTDARMVLQYAVQKIDAEALDLSVADVDGNGNITSTDARLILQHSVNKIAKFPVEE